jgi:hypothetical protein
MIHYVADLRSYHLPDHEVLRPGSLFDPAANNRASHDSQHLLSGGWVGQAPKDFAQHMLVSY